MSIGTGFCQATPKTDDAYLNWANRSVDIVSESIRILKQTSLNCSRNKIYYARINPEIPKTFPIDSTTKLDLQNLSDKTMKYLMNNSEKLKQLCQRLVASLLYVDDVKLEGEKTVKITINSRHLPFVVPSELGGPSWKLECIPLRGEFESHIEERADHSWNPLAIIRISNLEEKVSLKIEMVIENKRFTILGGRAHIQLQPPYLSVPRQQKKLVLLEDQESKKRLLFSKTNRMRCKPHMHIYSCLFSPFLLK
jgi:hypothetical protein